MMIALSETVQMSPSPNALQSRFGLGRPISAFGGMSVGASGGEEARNGERLGNGESTNVLLMIEGARSQSEQKPCHFARLALLCCQNAICLGAPTQLGLCPPGPSRRSLQAAMRTKYRRSRPSLLSRLVVNVDGSEIGGLYGLDRMIGIQALTECEEKEEDYLLNTNTFDVESDGEQSSGDEDELIDFNVLLQDDQSLVPPDEKYLSLREPLFTPNQMESNMTNPINAAANAQSKIPFNYRKIRFFDAVTAASRAKARKYLRQEVRKSKRRQGVVLKRHLKRMQRLEKRQLLIERGHRPEPDNGLHDQLDPKDELILNGGVELFDAPMTCAMSAALLIESLSINSIESLEGMSKCYEGIVAAGVALLDLESESINEDGGKPRTSRAEILAALAPLLISSLEQPSGEVFCLLAKLRRMCGTHRYQRRFVQRVAPALVRPPRGAMWCLRHQHDIEPIMAASELIFDSVSEIFGAGWYERGQQLLADSVRKETLNSAAQQLRNMSSEHDNANSLAFSLNASSHHGHSLRRGNSLKFLKSGTQREGGGGVQALAEWEVIAVDRQIRSSISDLFAKDWTPVVAPPRDAEVSFRSRRSSAGAVAGISRTRSGEASPKASSSPRSPTRPRTLKSPLSPQSKHHPSHGAPPNPEHLEYSVPSLKLESPKSPPLARRTTDPYSMDVAASVTKTPPRSPTSPPNTPAVAVVPSSPRSSMKSPPPQPHPSPIGGGAPLSPGGVTHTDGPHRVSSTVSISPATATASQVAHYRMLTSTAAERKRTVAACRALRSQIQRFEEAFMQLHGRPPKGAAERAPLATTYAQYREWKRAIRADAAFRIQALFRGARTRWALLHSNDPRATRVVMSRAGRASSRRGHRLSGRGGHVLNDLSIPVEIGAEADRGVGLSPLPGSQAAPENAGVEVYINSPQNPISDNGQWRSQNASRRSPASGDRSTSSTSYAASNQQGSPSAATADLSRLSLANLQDRKRELKQQLKQYDLDFAAQHGRMPTKPEKEPIRHLYETYNALKRHITTAERQSPRHPNHTQQQPAPQPQPSQPSPPAAAAAAETMSASIQQRSLSASSRTTTTTSSSSPSPPHVAGSVGGGDAPVRASRRSASAPDAGEPQRADLAALREEKARLHQMLRSYERDFYREHRRQVSSFADIRPVASQYRRYKEIKRILSPRQSGGGER